MGLNMKIRIQSIWLLMVFAAALLFTAAPVSAATITQPLSYTGIVGVDFAGSEDSPDSSGLNTASNSNALLDGRNSEGFFSNKSGNRHRFFFLRFDFSYYMDKLDAVDSIKLRLFTNGDGNNNASSKFEIYLLHQEDAKKVNRNDITNYGDAIKINVAYDEVKTGEKDEQGEELFNKIPKPPVWTHTTGLDINKAYETGDFAARVKEQLASGEPIIGLKVIGTAGYGLFVNAGAEEPRLQIGLESEELTHIDEAMKKITFATFSSENNKNITNSLSLPSVVDGDVAVAWRSSDTSCVTNSGEVIRPPFGEANKVITIEGIFSYKGYDSSTSFTMTVLSDKENPLYKGGEAPIVLPAIDTEFVRGGAFAGQAMSTLLFKKRLDGDSASGNNNRVAFAKFDLSSKKSLLDQTEFIKLRLIPYNYLPLESGTDMNAASVNVSVALVDCDDWNGDTITYNIANRTTPNMLTSGTEVHTSSGKLDMNGYYTVDIKAAATAYFAANPEKNNITLRIKSTSGTFSFHGLSAEQADLKPSLIVLNNKGATDAAYDYLKFSKISNDDIDAVRRNLDFSHIAGDLAAADIKSTTVTWSSSSPEAVNPTTGAVTRAQNDQTVTLTANIKTGDVTRSKVFVLTVRGYAHDAAHFKELVDGIAFDTLIVSGNFAVPSKLDGFDVNWKSSEDYVINVSGGTANVTRMRSREIDIKLTANILYDGVSASRDFNFTVLRRPDADLLRKMKIVDGGGTKSMAIDDDTSTLWTPSGDRAMTIDLSGSKGIAEFVLIYDGAAVSGLTIEMFTDRALLINTGTYKSGELQPKTVNYLPLKQPAYAGYVRITCPSGVSGVRFFSGYSKTTEEVKRAEFWSSISIPDRVSGDFHLPLSVDGYDYSIEWKSADTSFINIDGSAARVTRGTDDKVVRITGFITNYTTVTDELQTEWYKDVIVAGVGSVVNSIGGGGRGGSGGSSVVSNDLIQPSIPVNNPSSTVTPFKDLNDAEWAKDYIISLYEKGVINGKGDGLFDPNGFTKREEMAKLLTVGLSLSAARNDINFNDVGIDDWYYSYVSDLCDSGLTNGMGDGLFGVGLNITRQDTAVMLARFIKSKGISGESAADAFVDANDISDYAKESVNVLKSLSIVSGDNEGKFNPSANITRAEICKLIYLVLNKIN